MKAYKIVMMRGDEIRIDSDELPKILQGIATNSPVIIKQGIFNPSSYSHIVKDTSREVIEEVDEDNHYTGRRLPKPLEDIFRDVAVIAEQKSLKRLK